LNLSNQSEIYSGYWAEDSPLFGL